MSQTISREISLYELESALLELIDIREQAETDEERQVADDQIRLYVQAEVRKADGIIAFRQTCLARAAAAKTEAERLGKIARAWGRRAERLDEMTLGAMQSFGVKRIEGNLGTFQVKQNPPSVEVYDQGLVPIEYMQVSLGMSGRLWNSLEGFLSLFLGVIGGLSPEFHDLWVTETPTVECSPRKLEIAKALKQSCGTCRGKGVIDDGLEISDADLDHCPGCGGSGKQGVPGARLVVDKVRLEVR